MAVKKKGLGKGLDSLIPEKSNKPLAKEPAEEKRESESGSGISRNYSFIYILLQVVFYILNHLKRQIRSGIIHCKYDTFYFQF